MCHLWNLVAEDTREGQVFRRLFEKLDEQHRSLGGQVFDVLGQAFANQSLRDLLIEAVRYGERPDVKAQLDTVLDETVGDSLRQVIHDRALVTDLMTAEDVERIREDMERAQARKLQPHFVRSFFIDAFTLLGGEIREREPGRFEISKVPGELRQRARDNKRVLFLTGTPMENRVGEFQVLVGHLRPEIAARVRAVDGALGSTQFRKTSTPAAAISRTPHQTRWTSLT